MSYDNPPQNLVTKVRRKDGKVHITLEFDIIEDGHNTKEEFRSRLAVTTPWLLEHLYTWADFDYSYSINLFSDALYNLGKGLLRWDNSVTSTSNGRRAMQAGKQLETAYDRYFTEDKSYCYWYKMNHVKFIRVKDSKYGNVSQMTHDYHISEEYATKMWETIQKRTEKQEKDRKAYAWSFIHKYIERFWD